MPFQCQRFRFDPGTLVTLGVGPLAPITQATNALLSFPTSYVTITTAALTQHLTLSRLSSRLLKTADNVSRYNS